MRSVYDSPTTYSFPLTPADRTRVDALFAALRDKRDAIAALHSLVLPLFSPRVPSPEEINPSKWDIVVECFLAVHCLRRGGIFAAPHEVSGILAKLKYVIRATCVYEIWDQQASYDNDLLRSVPSLLSLVRLLILSLFQICRGPGAQDAPSRHHQPP